ncbi:unnamed protein product [Adineta steineri]|uniref:G-protein coupled receptors family 1 profile domain-containing protein n=1 Tax=Adineta steineri TaxID=433720 RepID=A0A819IUT4_9BILA|nr:unnamed protein product [Adineta steineri]CAF3919517.1 unnamed protein product [Adineta steineri]
MNNTTSAPLLRPGSNSSRPIVFTILVSLFPPSILCFGFVFYNFMSLRQLRINPINRFLMTLLIFNFLQIIVDFPFRLYYLSKQNTLIQNTFFCLLWNWYDSILTTINLFIMAIGSIERYIFIFQLTFFRRHSFSFFILSMFICILIPTAWYTGLIFAYPCTNSLSYTRLQCGELCYLTKSLFFSTFESYVFLVLPVTIIFFTNSLLILRVILQKTRMERLDTMRLWYKNIRMISQLLFVSVLYTSIFLPSTILLFMATMTPSNPAQIWANNIRVNYFFHLKYLAIFGCPFVILASQPKMHEQIKRFIRYCCPLRHQHNTNQIIPLTVRNTNR